MRAPSINSSIVASLAALSMFTSGVDSIPASSALESNQLNSADASGLNLEPTSSFAQLSVPTATTSLSNADDLSVYSQDTRDERSHHVQPREPIARARIRGKPGGNGNKGRSKTKFGEEVDKFIPQARQLIANARADQASADNDTLYTLNELLRKAESMEGKDGDEGNQLKGFRDTIEELKRRTSDQPPISEHDALIGAENAVNELETWVSSGKPSATVPTWALTGATVLGLLLM